jgi:hypothetical protein
MRTAAVALLAIVVGPLPGFLPIHATLRIAALAVACYKALTNKAARIAAALGAIECLVRNQTAAISIVHACLSPVFFAACVSIGLGGAGGQPAGGLATSGSASGCWLNPPQPWCFCRSFWERPIATRRSESCRIWPEPCSLRVCCWRSARLCCSVSRHSRRCGRQPERCSESCCCRYRSASRFSSCGCLMPRPLPPSSPRLWPA